MKVKSLIGAVALSSTALVGGCEKKATEVTPKIEKAITSVVEASGPKTQEISFFRVTTGFLTKEQITEINRTKMLPDNCKFVKEFETDDNGNKHFTGDYTIDYNLFNITSGTQRLPEGFEVKQNLIGQAIVVPVGTKGLLIRE